MRRIRQTLANNQELARVVDEINSIIQMELTAIENDSFSVDDILTDSDGNVMTGSDGNIMLK